MRSQSQKKTLLAFFMIVLVLLIWHPGPSLAGGRRTKRMQLADRTRTLPQAAAPTPYSNNQRASSIAVSTTRTHESAIRNELFDIAASIGTDTAYIAFNAPSVRRRSRAHMKAFVTEIFNYFIPLNGLGKTVPRTCTKVLEKMTTIPYPDAKRCIEAIDRVSKTPTGSTSPNVDRLALIWFSSWAHLVQTWNPSSPEMVQLLIRIKDGALAMWKTAIDAGVGAVSWELLFEMMNFVAEGFDASWGMLEAVENSNEWGDYQGRRSEQ
ncbi:hypothetical protein HK102_000469 [Quaeritorhiza haematococci]|nr:hypothetical protein HK102_000469 [Quaeritorhiza haematococci]